MYDSNNKIVKLCAEGMEFEGQGRKNKAFENFNQAWEEASNDFEKFTAAHYVARHQENVADKLKWDEIALHLALKINDETVIGAYPSLYLNIAKGYEDLNDFDNAKKNYELALSFTLNLSDDGYGNMIKGGILNGIERIRKQRTANNVNKK
jgi:rifampin ADP-ribosylating transferase